MSNELKEEIEAGQVFHERFGGPVSSPVVDLSRHPYKMQTDDGGTVEVIFSRAEVDEVDPRTAILLPKIQQENRRIEDEMLDLFRRIKGFVDHRLVFLERTERILRELQDRFASSISKLTLRNARRDVSEALADIQDELTHFQDLFEYVQADELIESGPRFDFIRVGLELYRDELMSLMIPLRKALNLISVAQNGSEIDTTEDVGGDGLWRSMSLVRRQFNDQAPLLRRSDDNFLLNLRRLRPQRISLVPYTARLQKRDANGDLENAFSIGVPYYPSAIIRQVRDYLGGYGVV